MSAVLSVCGRYRHRLDRDVQFFGAVAALIGINPSTADATRNDATIRKEIGFAKANGWRRIIKGNVFDYRATDVGELADVDQPVSPQNERYLREIAAQADVLVACWGNTNKVPSALRGQFDLTLALLRATGKPVMCFGKTIHGHPCHPLMLPYSTKLVPF